MEHHAQSVGDALIGGLSYKLKAGASYVTNRRSVSYFAQGGNDYKPSGVRVMKFHLTGDQWMDPSTFRAAFQLDILLLVQVVQHMFSHFRGIRLFSFVVLGSLREVKLWKILMISIASVLCLPLSKVVKNN